MSVEPLGRQVAVLLKVSAFVGAPVGVAFVSLYWLTRSNGVPFTDLSRDAAATYGFPWYGGSLSLVGVLIAGSAGALALFGGWLGRRLADPREGLMWWLGSGMLVFALDDGLLLHEEVLPGIGVPEEVVIAAFVVWGVIIVAKFWRPILGATDYAVFSVGFGLLGLQGLVDAGLPIPVSSAAVEDPLKITGVILVLIYVVLVARRMTNSLIDRPSLSIALETVSSEPSSVAPSPSVES